MHDMTSAAAPHSGRFLPIARLGLLALALALAGEPGIVALSGDTDGTDGGGGEATDPAGAIIDETTLARARALTRLSV